MNWFSKKVTKDSEEPLETSPSTNGFELNKEELAIKSEERKLPSKDIQNKNTNLIEIEKNGLKFQLIRKLNEIDKFYKRGLVEYKENIQAYNIEIEKLKNQITFESEYCDKEEKRLLFIEHELGFESNIYEKLQVKFSQFINSIEELKNEYKDVLDEVRYRTTLKRKEKELFELLDDIEVSELTLLNKELERLNVVEKLEPKQVQLKKVKIALKEIEMEKSYFESMGLHKVSSVEGIENKSFWNAEETSEVVDTVEVDTNT